jgi:hypothetical protein
VSAVTENWFHYLRKKSFAGNEALFRNLDQKEVRLKYGGARPFHTQQLGGQGTFLSALARYS